ncbi:HNH endonuclease [Microvirga sp. BT688]|uniref:HNH endonuclease n=1 Tax=Microvirga sp. TaxID=1873136 RepID=UPI001688828E|nr:HNH endonuclease signature motif containing protein [Microvirga sp.]MBD2747780.1 HNH endonuclease [Microvirga sp.]
MPHGIDVPIGKIVKRHLNAIKDYCEANPTELENLMDPAYSSKIFGLGRLPFFAEVGSPVLRDENTRYWQDPVFTVNGKIVRVCSQWVVERHLVPFQQYLVSKNIATTYDPPSPAPTRRGIPSRQRMNTRYRAYRIADAQNAVIRHILSNLGEETFNEADWENTKQYFSNRCAYCGIQGSLQMDHGFPINKSKLGEHRIGNLIPSCGICNNSRKGDKDFKEFLGSDADKIRLIEEYMESRQYTPLAGNAQVKDILEMAYKDVAVLAERYVAILETLLSSAAPPTQADPP